jgi:predicted metal-dependent peptidase
MASKKRNKRNRSPNQHDEAAYNFSDAKWDVNSHPIFSALSMWVDYRRAPQHNPCPRDGWAVVTNTGDIYVHPSRLAEPKEWVYILIHCLLHLGFGHFQQRENPAAWNAACDVFVARFMQDLKLGRPPVEMSARVEGLPRAEEDIYRRFCEHGIPEDLQVYGTAGVGELDMLFREERPPQYFGRNLTWQELFGQGLANGVSQAVDYAAGAVDSMRLYDSVKKTSAQLARGWFMSSYPLMGALAAGFKIIEDPLTCQRMQIRVAAVDAEMGELYINPATGLNEEECRFVMAHELLHVSLRHHARRQGRDFYLWNVACDYVINQWLVEMGIGTIPQIGLLLDPELRGLNAEAVYDLIVNDLRRYRKLATLRGVGLCDMIEPSKGDWWNSRDGMALDEFYRRALAQGLEYHQCSGRGFIPAGLIEEIMAANQPPIPWDVELAHWFDQYFPPVDQVRSYARPSRRQAATPDIPRPRYVPDWKLIQSRTFGVVLDTSGSMDRQLLAKALGAIASYSIAREVVAVRVVFCDAHPYDQGFMPPEDIAGRVKIRGRGGTVLQPGIRLLQNAEDFPKSGPILIITDTECDRLTVRHDHAFLIPDGKHLPFAPRGPVFRLS